MGQRTLCFDTSSRDFSVALLEGGLLVAEGDSSRSHGPSSGSRSLAPTIGLLMDKAGWRMADLERIVLPIGPGSFSGLRMGVVTAKVLGFSLGIPIFGLNTLAVIAGKAVIQGHARPGDEVVALLDAQRGELFAQRFLIDSAGLPQAAEMRHVIPLAELESAYPNGRLTGSGLELLYRPLRRGTHDEAAAQRVAALVDRLVPEESWASDASHAGQLAHQIGSELQPIDHWNLVPDYGRPSAAEEKAIAREIEPRRNPER